MLVTGFASQLFAPRSQDSTNTRPAGRRQAFADGCQYRREGSLAEALLDAVGTSLREVRVSNDQQTALWNDAPLLYRQTVQQRWVVVDASGGTIPTPLISLVIAWLVMIFGSFGYRAPRSAIVIGYFDVAALLMSGTLFLILDMDAPTKGLIQVSTNHFSER